MPNDTKPAMADDRERAALPELLTRFERQAQRFGELWERCQGKGWAEAESAEFHKIRDERLPALRAEIQARAALSSSVQAAEPADDFVEGFKLGAMPDPDAQQAAEPVAQ